MNIKYWILVGILALGVVFLAMDNCGNSSKYQKLRGEYNIYKTISKVVVAESIKTINKQGEEIKKLDEKIGFLNTIIETKDEDLAELDNKVTNLEDEFGKLSDKDAKIGNLTKQVEVWKDKFSISQSIIKDKDGIIFSLTKKYEAQLKVSNSYKSMYKSAQDVLTIRDKQVKELEKINRQLKLTSKLKTGIVVVAAGVVLYSLIRK